MRQQVPRTSSVYLKTLFNCIGYAASNEKMAVNNDWNKRGKETAMAYFKALAHRLHGGLEKRTRYLRQSVSNPSTEPGTANHSNVRFYQ
jgi:hypothetical protein